VFVNVDGVARLAVQLVSKFDEMWHLRGVGVAVEGNKGFELIEAKVQILKFFDEMHE
jgi:hypothetical protein